MCLGIAQDTDLGGQEKVPKLHDERLATTYQSVNQSKRGLLKDKPINASDLLQVGNSSDQFNRPPLFPHYTSSDTPAHPPLRHAAI